MPISEQTFRQIALEDPEGHWELYCGVLRQKPDMSVAHNYVVTRLFEQLIRQLDPSQFDARANMGHVQRSTENYFIPDVFVVPMALVRSLLQHPDALEAYGDPLPLVVEVWSPSTGTYDVETKLREYQRRGDHEIWHIHPFERELTAWRRQPDGAYVQTTYDQGIVRPAALLGVSIDLDALFA